MQLIISFKQDEVNTVRQNMAIETIKADIKRLEEKQDKHNQLIERIRVQADALQNDADTIRRIAKRTYDTEMKALEISKTRSY